MRILVAGGRDFCNRRTIRNVLAAYDEHPPPVLVHGAAYGADRTVARIAQKMGWETEPHPADWETHGRTAGPIRNHHMASLGGDVLIAFPGGTTNMIRCAERAGIPVQYVTEKETRQWTT